MEPIGILTTGSAGTKDWLEASKGMVIIAYVDNEGMMPVTSPLGTQTTQGHLFGTHIKEALEAWGFR